MVNYYETLKVSPNATGSEIKSAYRRLARKLHPDKNNGSEFTARAFAEIAEAYEILRHPTERALYDQRLLQVRIDGGKNSNTVFSSSNIHARRWRQMAYERRYNEIIDRMIDEERREATALQRVVFPTVALFVFTFIAAMFKPQIFVKSAVVVKILLVSLFVAGLIHLFRRLRDGLERYTYLDDADLHESILDDNEPRVKPYSRFSAASFLLLGVTASFVIGLLSGQYIDFLSVVSPEMFSSSLKPEFIFYPPIMVMFVDLMHSFAARVEG